MQSMGFRGRSRAMNACKGSMMRDPRRRQAALGPVAVYVEMTCQSSDTDRNFHLVLTAFHTPPPLLPFISSLLSCHRNAKDVFVSSHTPKGHIFIIYLDLTSMGFRQIKSRPSVRQQTFMGGTILRDSPEQQIWIY